MPYTCKNCHQEYEADAERTDGLCDGCRAMPDWKAPLYDYAVQQEKSTVNPDVLIDLYIRLGSYRDCAQRLDKFQQKKKADYDQAVKCALEGVQLSLVNEAIQMLDRMGDYLEARQMAQKGREHHKELEEKLRLEREEQERREAAKKRLSTLIKLAIAAAAVVLFVIWGFVLPPVNLNKADEALANGEYAEAVALYEKAALFSTIEAASEGLEAARCEWVASLLEEGKPDEAYTIIEQVTDYRKNEALLLDYVEALLDAGRTGDAYKTLRSMRGIDGRDELLARCGQMQMDAGDYEAAATTFNKLDDDENYRIARNARAEQLLAQGEYKKALLIWDELEDKESSVSAAELYAQSLKAQNQYDDAMAVCDKYGLLETGNAILREWIAASMAEGSYADALDVCEEYDRPDVADEVRAAWADDLLALNNYAQALELREKMQPTEENIARTAEIWMTFARLKADEAISTSADADTARAIGEELTNVDAQLLYCHALYSAGYDLAQVYPNGVIVKNTPLGPYNIEDLENTLIVPPNHKILVFERLELPYNNLLGQIVPASADRPVLMHSRTSDGSYTILLHPKYMFDQPGIQPPESWDDASAMIVLDGLYLHAGDITVENYEYTYGPGTATKKRLIGTSEHPFFDAVSALSLFVKGDLENCAIWSAQTDEPTCADDEWFNAHDDDEDVILLWANRMGSFDLTTAYEELPAFITFITALAGE